MSNLNPAGAASALANMAPNASLAAGGPPLAPNINTSQLASLAALNPGQPAIQSAVDTGTGGINMAALQKALSGMSGSSIAGGGNSTSPGLPTGATQLPTDASKPQGGGGPGPLTGNALGNYNPAIAAQNGPVTMPSGGPAAPLGPAAMNPLLALLQQRLFGGGTSGGTSSGNSGGIM
jgi:hypothetical protein